MPTLSEIKAGAKAAGFSSSSKSSARSTLEKYGIKIGNTSNVNPIPKSGLNIRPFQESNFIGFTGFGTDNLKQFSYGDIGTKFIDEREARQIGAITDQGRSIISGKGVFDTFRSVVSDNLVNLGKSQIDASEALQAQADQTTKGFEGITEFIQQVQGQLGDVDKRLSEQLTQAGADITEVGAKSNGDGESFWNNLASALGVSVPILAVGGVAALLLLRR